MLVQLMLLIKRNDNQLLILWYIGVGRVVRPINEVDTLCLTNGVK